MTRLPFARCWRKAPTRSEALPRTLREMIGFAAERLMQLETDTLCGAVAQYGAQLLESLADAVLRDRDAGPDSFHDGRAVDQAAGVLDEEAEQRGYLRPQRQLDIPGEQNPAGKVQRETAEPTAF